MNELSLSKAMIVLKALMVMYDIVMTDIRKLDPQILLVFESLLETKSTTLSASRLGLSQSAVSGALRRLREVFDDVLFERHNRGLRPTTRANELSIAVAQILSSMRSLSASLDFDPATAQGTITLLATDYALATMIAPLRNKLADTAPGITVAVQAYSSEEAFSNASLLTTDLLIGSPQMLPDTLQSRHLKTDRLMLFMSAAHPLANSEISIEDLVAYPHIMVSLRGRSARGEIDELLKKAGYERTVDTITPSFLSLQTLLSTSVRLAIAPESLTGVTDNLICKPLPVQLTPVELYAAWHKRFSDDKRHIWLRQTLQTWVAEQQ